MVTQERVVQVCLPRRRPSVSGGWSHVERNKRCGHSVTGRVFQLLSQNNCLEQERKNLVLVHDTRNVFKKGDVCLLPLTCERNSCYVFFACFNV